MPMPSLRDPDGRLALLARGAHNNVAPGRGTSRHVHKVRDDLLEPVRIRIEDDGLFRQRHRERMLTGCEERLARVLGTTPPR